MNLRLSVVSICRNDAGGLARTLTSTFKNQQSFDCWEQIIVDGASTDGSFNAIAPYKGNPHLGWHVSEPDKGIYNAMNKGAAHARGDYLLFLNSGDELMPGVLEKVFSSAFDADIAYGDESVVGNTGREGTWSVAEEDFTPAFFLLSGFPHQSCFISRTWFWKLGGYDESLRIVGDTEFLLRSRLNPDARIVRLPFVVSRYRLDGLSSNPRFARARMEERHGVPFRPIRRKPRGAARPRGHAVDLGGVCGRSESGSRSCALHPAVLGDGRPDVEAPRSSASPFGNHAGLPDGRFHISRKTPQSVTPCTLRKNVRRNLLFDVETDASTAFLDKQVKQDPCHENTKDRIKNR